MKKILFLLLVVFTALAGWIVWGVFGPTLNEQKGPYFYLPTTVDKEAALAKLTSEKIISTSRWASYLLDFSQVKNIKAGRYKIKKGMSVFQLVRNLKNGKHTPVKLVINKIRTREELAGLIGERIDSKIDSMELITYLKNNDSLAFFSVDTNQILSLVMPYTYELNWSENPKQIMSRFEQSWNQFWTPSNKEKAKKLGLSPLDVSSLAAIVEEETNHPEDRYKIASTYLNRLKIGMKLQADPTAKYASRNFKLNRILYGHLAIASPYNTYQNTGLPPGPICTPSLQAIQAVLDAPKTDYLFFVASWKFDGSTIFSPTYKQHQRYVQLFHDAQLKRAQ